MCAQPHHRRGKPNLPGQHQPIETPRISRHFVSKRPEFSLSATNCAMSAIRTLPWVRAVTTRPALTQRGLRPLSTSAYRSRGVVFNGYDDLGGPGGSEHPFKKEEQNR